MEKKKKRIVYIPVNTLEEAEAIYFEALKAGEIPFSFDESEIPDEIFKKCKSLRDIVKAAQEYLSNRCVTDKEFYKLISDDSAYLGDNFAQKKIKQWQSEITSPDAGKAFDAQEKLKKIGQVLALKKTRKSPRFIFEVVAKRYAVYAILKQHEVSKKRGDGFRRLTLKSLFDKDTIDSIPDDIPQRDDELADIITARLMNVKVSMVEKYRKKQVKKLPDRLVFLPKK